MFGDRVTWLSVNTGKIKADLFDKNKTKYLKLEIREAHQEGHMYWTCQKRVIFN